MANERPLLVYDGDCGFCTRSVRLVERLPVRVRVRAWQELPMARLGLSAERARREVLWVPAQGPVRGGAAAVAALLRHTRGPWRLVGAAMDLPVARTAAAAAYRLVAANRYRLPGSTPACRLPPPQRPGAE